MASATSYDLLIWQPKEQLNDALHKARKLHAITNDHDDKYEGEKNKNLKQIQTKLLTVFIENRKSL